MPRQDVQSGDMVYTRSGTWLTPFWSLVCPSLRFISAVLTLPKQTSKTPSVPIALIITIIMRTIGIVWWEASLSARVETLEHRFAELGAYQARIVRLEEKQNAVYHTKPRKG